MSVEPQTLLVPIGGCVSTAYVSMFAAIQLAVVAAIVVRWLITSIEIADVVQRTMEAFERLTAQVRGLGSAFDGATGALQRFKAAMDDTP